MATSTGQRVADLRERSKPEVDRNAFARFRHSRPFVGSILAIIAGVEMFFSGQLDIGKIHIAVGIEGFQATIIPIAMILLGVLVMVMPQHRVFYGVIILAVSLYSLIGDNIGGFLIGMLLGSVGGIIIVSWMPRTVKEPAPEPVEGPAKTKPVASPKATTATSTAHPERETEDGFVHAEYVEYKAPVKSRPMAESRS